MPLIDTPETPIPHYTHAVTTKNEGDGNDVVYDRWIKYPNWEPVWNKFSYEDQLRKEGIVVTPPGGTTDAPIILPPDIPSQPVGRRAWGTIQLTRPEDGFIPRREYSYWPHTVVVGSVVHAIVCSDQGKPNFFRVDPDGSVFRRGPLINYRGEGEGWYFGPDARVYLIDGPRLRRVNPFGDEDEVVMDISATYGNHNLWQAHSSLDGNVHIATVRQNSNDFNPHVATVISHYGTLHYIEAKGNQDEAHITADGTYGIIEIDNNNQIIECASGREVTTIQDADYALSHIDCGVGFMVGEDNIHGIAWKIDLPSLRRTELERTWGMGHVSVQNNKCLLSNAGSLMWMDLNGGGLTHILDHGMVGDPNDYEYQVKANLDHTATVALYMTNQGGKARQEVMLKSFV